MSALLYVWLALLLGEYVNLHEGRQLLSHAASEQAREKWEWGEVGREFIPTIASSPVKEVFSVSVFPAFIDQEVNELAYTVSFHHLLVLHTVSYAFTFFWSLCEV